MQAAGLASFLQEHGGIPPTLPSAVFLRGRTEILASGSKNAEAK
jgi:hypothetical protein